MTDKPLTPYQKAAVAEGWRKTFNEEAQTYLWTHPDRPTYGYYNAQELCEDWSYPVEEDQS